MVEVACGTDEGRCESEWLAELVVMADVPGRRGGGGGGSEESGMGRTFFLEAFSASVFPA
ncbi:hypothetical protein E2C01_055477 [Portunus trituberculatus]|uniref:Uncharacterized protein n=1 Tax=Portunus trituberculatus TaxID=210409 RepID=A0A5B7GVL1_PORTR|nr:hypothetical protein [Portunus trituberculatus]